MALRGRSWREHAACKGVPIEVFFVGDDNRYRSHGGKDIYREARSYCAACPVRRECLDDGISAESWSRHGFFGGMTPRERDDEARLRSAERRRVSA